MSPSFPSRKTAEPHTKSREPSVSTDGLCVSTSTGFLSTCLVLRHLCFVFAACKLIFHSCPLSPTIRRRWSRSLVTSDTLHGFDTPNDYPIWSLEMGLYDRPDLRSGTGRVRIPFYFRLGP